jgi:hypothetical protein
VDNQRVLAACLSENALRMSSNVTENVSENVPEILKEEKRPSARSERQGELDTTS